MAKCCFSWRMAYMRSLLDRARHLLQGAPLVSSGGTKLETSANMPLLRLQSSEGKFTMAREIEPVSKSFRRHGSCAFAEVARLVPSED